MSMAEIRYADTELSKEQLETLTDLETKKRHHCVMSLTMYQLADEYAKLEAYWRHRKDEARKSGKDHNEKQKEFDKKSVAMFKKFNMNRIN